ncbi:MAG: aldehyde oxidase, partial [Bacillota bacterium]
MPTINKKTKSVDGLGIMLGRPAYTDDLAHSDSLIIKVLRSPHAFAEIVSIDKEDALKVPGVVCILTHEDVPRNVYTRAGQGYPEPSPHDKFVLDHMVRYVGDEVAIVAAETETIALDALKKINVTYNVLEPVLDFETAMNHTSVIHPEKESHEMFPIGFDKEKNIAASYHMEVDDVKSRLEA